MFLLLMAHYMQVLINQLKEVSPAIQKSISECTEKVNSLPPTLPPAMRSNGQAASLLQSQGSGRIMVTVGRVLYSLGMHI